MPFPMPHYSPAPAAEPPPAAALVSVIAREDVSWDRPVFKAPPLELHPQAFDATRFARDLRGIGLVER